MIEPTTPHGGDTVLTADQRQSLIAAHIGGGITPTLLQDCTALVAEVERTVLDKMIDKLPQARDMALEEAARLIETTRETTSIVGGGDAQRHLTPRKEVHDLTGMTWVAGIRDLKSAPSVQALPAVPLIARALNEWHDDDGPVMWWAWCGPEWAGEAPWCGTPLDSDWPGYHTHWTPMPAMPAAQGERHE